MGLVLSVAQGGFHPYYTTEMAPALAAVTAAGVAAMWRHYRRPGGYRWLLFPAAVTLTVGWAWLLVSRDILWNGWLRYAVAGVGVAAVVLLVAGRLSVRDELPGSRGAQRGGIAARSWGVVGSHRIRGQRWRWRDGPGRPARLRIRLWPRQARSGWG